MRRYLDSRWILLCVSFAYCRLNNVLYLIVMLSKNFDKIRISNVVYMIWVNRPHQFGVLGLRAQKPYPRAESKLGKRTKPVSYLYTYFLDIKIKWIALRSSESEFDFYSVVGFLTFVLFCRSPLKCRLTENFTWCCGFLWHRFNILTSFNTSIAFYYPVRPCLTWRRFWSISVTLLIRQRGLQSVMSQCFAGSGVLFRDEACWDWIFIMSICILYVFKREISTICKWKEMIHLFSCHQPILSGKFINRDCSLSQYLFCFVLFPFVLQSLFLFAKTWFPQSLR